MKENSVVITSVGIFEYAQMGKGIVVYLKNGANVFLSANWWSKDEVRKAIEDNIGLINKKIAEHANKEDGKEIVINDINDASKLLQMVNDYAKGHLEGKDRGFVTSRLTQVINKLNEQKN